jgi:pimeloyl-ACP methyl ester carboxylesterase
MGLSDNPGYSTIDIFNRLIDVRAVATQIMINTGRRPVVMGWSQGGLLAGLLAASDPNANLIAGVVLLSVPPQEFVVPLQFPDIAQQAVPTLLTPGVTSFLPTPNEVKEIVFGTDPITGMPTISPDAFATFVSPQFLQTDSTKAILEEANLCPILVGSPFVNGCPAVARGSITVPALVVDGAQDPLVGEDLAEQLFNIFLTGTTNKQLIIFPRNSHGWFLEDNHDEIMRVFDRFLSQF